MTTVSNSDNRTMPQDNLVAATGSVASTSSTATDDTGAHAAGSPHGHGQGHGHGHLGQDLAHKIFAASIPGTEIKKQISYIAPGQTAKALMLIYLTFSVPIVLLAIIVGFIRYHGQIELSAMFSTIFSALIVNAVVGFVLLWIACQAYNWVASRFGGIEIVLADAPEDV